MSGKITRIHVNQHNIKHNRKMIKEWDGMNIRPVLTVKDYKENRKGCTAIIRDKEGNAVAHVVYSPNKPLPCGAVCWIETREEVEVI